MSERIAVWFHFLAHLLHSVLDRQCSLIFNKVINQMEISDFMRNKSTAVAQKCC